MARSNDRTPGRDSKTPGRTHLSLVKPESPAPAAPGSRRHGTEAHRQGFDTERDVLTQVADDLDRAICALPDGSRWRAWLADVSRVARVAGRLPRLRRVGGHRKGGADE